MPSKPADLPAFALPMFTAPYASDDIAIARQLLDASRLSANREAKVDQTATTLIEAIRSAVVG